MSAACGFAAAACRREREAASGKMGGRIMNDTSDTLTFEQSLVALERIIRELEDGKTGLEESLLRYEQGVKLLRRCYGQLQKSEQRIVELIGLDSDGQPLSRPFDHVAKMDSIK